MPGDVNRDGIVNGSDFAVLAANFGRTGRTWSQGDMTGDGVVNGSDSAVLAQNFGKTSTVATGGASIVGARVPAAPAPEPPSAGNERKPHEARARNGLRLLRRFAAEHGLRAVMRQARSARRR